MNHPNCDYRSDTPARTCDCAENAKLQADLTAAKIEAVGAYNRGYIKGLAEGRE